MVLNEAVFGVHRLNGATAMALATSFIAAVNLQRNAVRITHVQTARPVARLTLDAGGRPCAHDTLHVILVTIRAIACGMAATTVIHKLGLTGVVSDPTGILAHSGIGEVILVQIRGIANRRARLVGDNIAVLVHEARLPVIHANHVGDVVPGVPFRWVLQLGEGVRWRFAINHLV